MITRTGAVASALLASLTLAAPAVATGSHGEPAALDTQLRYRTTTWTADGVDMSVRAPRGWSLVVTPEGQARFNAPSLPDVLTMSEREEGSLRQQLHAQVAALQGTPGLRVLSARVFGRGDSVAGQLRYRWTRPDGEARVVEYRYQGDDVYAVAGRLVDRQGLEVVLDVASDTGECS